MTILMRIAYAKAIIQDSTSFDSIPDEDGAGRQVLKAPSL